MRLALHFHSDKIQVSRTGQSELVEFADGRDFLPTEFAIEDTGGVRRVHAPTHSAPEQRVKLHVEKDAMDLHLNAMDLHLRGANADNIPVDTVLRSVFEAVRSTTDDSDERLVIIGAENRLLKHAAMDAGFSDVAFMFPIEAAIRYAGGDAAGRVVVLFCHENGSLAWQTAAFSDQGDIIPKSRGQFGPADPARMDHGFGKFLKSLQECPVEQIIVTGNGVKTDAVEGFLSALAVYGYNVVSNANAVVIGASMPPRKSKYGQFDDLIEAAVDALSNQEFSKAIETLATATSLFEKPSAQIKQTTEALRLHIRAAILAAATETRSIDAEPLYEKILEISLTDPERADVYYGLLNMYGALGRLADAESAALTAGFYDRERENLCIGLLRSYSDNRPQDTPEAPEHDGCDANRSEEIISDWGTEFSRGIQARIKYLIG